ncbi:MAG: class I tRNA ligase family protein, partial [Gemmataceae bacterium]
LDWLGEKRDWCISRQLWWGHRIPIWYCRCPEAELKRALADRTDVAWRLDEENAQWLVCALEGDLPADAVGAKYPLEQDPDVLDTWFSSALWPHSTLGWPEQTPELAYYYPTSVLVTSRDIITLWVARMVLAGLFNLKNIPFKDVYIHPKILDGFGEGMSKSKGNGVDPLDIIERYGTDALRFTMVHLATENQDSRLPVSNVCPNCDELVPIKEEHMDRKAQRPREQIKCPKCKQAFRPGGQWHTESELPTARQAAEKFEMGRNFANKIWNAARFLLMNLEGYTPHALKLDDLPIEDRWILSRLAVITRDVTAQLEAFKFSEAARTLYDFTWSEYCDWYVEMSKGRLNDPAARPQAQRVLAGVFDAILRLIQPIMPFVAESIWQVLNETAFERGLPGPEPAAESVVIAPWPQFPDTWHDGVMEQRIGRLQDLVRGVRDVRARYMIDPKRPLELHIKAKEPIAADFHTLAPFIKQLAGIGQLECGPAAEKPKQAATHVHTDFEAYVSLEGLIDLGAEIKRLEKQLAEKTKFLQSSKAKLENPSFRDKAPPEVVQQQREAVADLQKQVAAIEQNLRELKAA